jgi:pimeloyl-ACP methyl ester carboxylesterase
MHQERVMRRLIRIDVLVLLTLTASLHAQSRAGSPAPTGKAGLPPLVLAEQGSFFVNAQAIETRFPSGNGTPVAGHISGKGMYVQYQIPKDRRAGAYPVVMVHGSSHTAKTYEDTPDGRMGWSEYFVRRGVPTYVVDHAGRARSGFDPTPTNQARLEKNAGTVPSFTVFTNENAWTNFRIGPTAFTPFPATKFPVQARDQYFAQIVPNTETSYAEGGRTTVAALAALLDRIGPAVVVVHSQSGAYGLGVAIERPALVKAVVSVEPRVCAVSDANLQVFAGVPLLTMFGDFFGTDIGDWPGRMAECIATVDKVKAAKGTAENIHLPSRGIPGNSHMLMMDTNNQQLADMILSWLDRHARAR